jgi:CRP-like cAMP-binding protein
LRQAADSGNGAAAALDLSQSDIADLIGSSRPKVNRALADLQANGTITREGRLIRGDLERLRRAARIAGD